MAIPSSSFERFRTWFFATRFGQLCWSLHSYIWKDSIIHKALKDIKVENLSLQTPADIDRKVRDIYYQCHFQGTFGNDSKKQKIKEELVNSIMQPLTNAVENWPETLDLEDMVQELKPQFPTLSEDQLWKVLMLKLAEKNLGHFQEENFSKLEVASATFKTDQGRERLLRFLLDDTKTFDPESIQKLEENMGLVFSPSLTQEEEEKTTIHDYMQKLFPDNPNTAAIVGFRLIPIEITQEFQGTDSSFTILLKYPCQTVLGEEGKKFLQKYLTDQGYGLENIEHALNTLKFYAEQKISCSVDTKNHKITFDPGCFRCEMEIFGGVSISSNLLSIQASGEDVNIGFSTFYFFKGVQSLPESVFFQTFSDFKWSEATI